MVAVDEHLERGRKRLQQVFQFLNDFNTLRNPVRTALDEQLFTLRLDDLPEHPSVERGWTDPESDFVLRVSRPEITDCPAPPAAVSEWLEPGWDDPERELRTRGERLIRLDVGEQRISFDDDNARVAALGAWRPRRSEWAARELPVRRSLRVFDQLYSLRGQLDRESEQVELLVGDAHLTWAVQKGIDHPLVLQRVELGFEPELVRFTLTTTERAPELYAPLLRSTEDVDGALIPQIATELSVLGLGPLSTDEEMAGFLRGLAARLAPHGRYVERNERVVAGRDPIVQRKATLFLRRRGQGFAAAIEAILADLEHTQELPASLLSIVGIEGLDHEGFEAPGSQYLPGQDPEILFTKAANDEQGQIARRLERHGAVIVQGPPGTGKTHTIANLVGHLLAQGKRVLVTSHTSKALERVRDLIVEDLRPLAVSVLSSDVEGRAQLESAIRGINARLSDDPDRLFSEAAELRQRRIEIVDELQRLSREIEEIVASEYLDVIVAGIAIAPSEAARQIATGRGQHDWIPGPIHSNVPLPLTTEEMTRLYASNADVTPDDERQLGLPLLETNKLAPPAHIEALVTEERDLTLRDSTNGAAAWKASLPSSVRLGELLAMVEDAALPSDAEGWMSAVLDAGLQGGGHRETWELLLTEIAAVLEIAERAAPIAARMDPQLPADLSGAAASNLLGQIAAHVASGKSLGRVALLLHGDWRTLLDGCSLIGPSPRSVEGIDALRAIAAREAARDSLRGLWDRVAAATGAPLSAEFGAVPERAAGQFTARIRRLLSWHSETWSPLAQELTSAGLSLDTLMQDVPERPESGGDLLRLRSVANDLLPAALRAAYVRSRLTEIRDELSESESIARASVRGHLSTDALPMIPDSIARRDPTGYRTAFDRIVSLQALRPTLALRQNLLERLQRGAPAWATEVERRVGSFGEPQPQGDVAAAWRWTSFAQELERRATLSLEERQGQVEQLRDELTRTTARLVDRLAWAQQVQRTGNAERQALNGWVEVIRKIGRGTGKRAPRLLAEARTLMAQSRTAVPVWIMPVNRVAESFDFRDRFDVVIVDEASQSDPLGLVALYLGRQAVIVGDHEQVSPDAVGQRTDDTDRLIDTYLDGVPNKVLYDGRSSVYDFGRRAFPGIVQLREHFRCVPDIIAFSNGLSYDGSIQPLREPTGVRTLPYCVPWRVNGWREGQVNRTEAEFIASAIVAAMELPEYQDATFGVISLLGDEQAKTIDGLLRRHLTPAEFERRRILVGSPPHFQGDERDVMFLSVVDAPTGGPLAMRSDEMFKRRYNVAASRARDQMWVVHSLNPDTDLKGGDLRERLIRHAMQPDRWATEVVTEKAESPFEEAVQRDLLAHDFSIEAQHRVGGYRIDMVVRGANDRRVALECDGDRYHGLDDIGRDMLRQAQLERLGWKFIRIRGSEFYRDPVKTMERVRSRLAELGIAPTDDASGAAPQAGGLVDAIVARAAEIREEWNEGRSAPDAGTSDEDTTVMNADVQIASPLGNLSTSHPVIQAGLDHSADEKATREFGLKPYAEWQARSAIPDPRSASSNDLVRLVAEVVDAEGPMTATRAYRLINQAAGNRKLARLSREPLQRAAREAVRRGLLIESFPLGAERILRTLEQPNVSLRERGPRELDEIPPDELGTLLRMMSAEGHADPKRKLLHVYGWRRLTTDIDGYLDLCAGLNA